MENFTTDEELLKDENYSADIDDEEDITDEDALEEISEEESEENNCNGDIRTAILMMNELKIYCEKKMIPMFSTIADVDEEKHTAKYITRTLTPFMARKNIVNDKITKFNAGVNGEFYLKVTAPGNSQIADLADTFTEETL
jgi:hypothetical protein